MTITHELVSAWEPQGYFISKERPVLSISFPEVSMSKSRIHSEPELLCVQVTHSITLLTLVHQNIYNSLTLLVSVLTRWKSDKGEEVGVFMVSRLRTMSSSSITRSSNIATTTHPSIQHVVNGRKAQKSKVLSAFGTMIKINCIHILQLDNWIKFNLS